MTDAVNKEITVRELLEKTLEYYREARRNWRLSILIVVPILFLSLFLSWKAPEKYSAKLTFMVNEDEGSSISGLSNLLGQFGLMATGGSSKFNLDKIIELSRSNRILYPALLTYAIVDGQNDYLANHLIRTYELTKIWSKKEEDLLDFSFRNVDPWNLSVTENKVLSELVTIMIGDDSRKGLLKSTIRERSGIMEMYLTTINEDLSVALVLQIYHFLGQFYVDKTIERHQRNFDLIKDRVDSIYGELTKIENQLATVKDRNRNVFLERNQVEEQRLERRQRMLELMYGEAAKNKELADFALSSSTPFIQEIDQPAKPIKPEKKSLLKSAVLGLLAGSMIFLFFVSGRKYIREALA